MNRVKKIPQPVSKLLIILGFLLIVFLSHVLLLRFY